MIKIPGTEAGLPAIRDTIAAGINVNVTLLFSPDRYRAVANAYFDGLEARLAAGKPIDKIASVASFFLSRIDTLVDKQLDDLAAKGKAEAKKLRGKCGHRQRLPCLWDLRRADCLLAMEGAREPRRTPAAAALGIDIREGSDLQPGEVCRGDHRARDRQHHAGRDHQGLPHHGQARAAPAERRLPARPRSSRACKGLGINMDAVAEQLESEGVKKFIEPFDKLQASIEERRIKLKAS